MSYGWKIVIPFNGRPEADLVSIALGEGATKLRFENPDVYNSIAALAAKPLIRIVLPIVN
jgi:hypothetical protein